MFSDTAAWNAPSSTQVSPSPTCGKPETCFVQGGPQLAGSFQEQEPDVTDLHVGKYRAGLETFAPGVEASGIF